MKTRQVMKCVDIHRRVDDGRGDTYDKHKKKEKAPRKFTHALRSPLSSTQANTLHVPQRHCGCG